MPNIDDQSTPLTPDDIYRDPSRVPLQAVVEILYADTRDTTSLVQETNLPKQVILWLREIRNTGRNLLVGNGALESTFANNGTATVSQEWRLSAQDKSSVSIPQYTDARPVTNEWSTIYAQPSHVSLGRFAHGLVSDFRSEAQAARIHSVDKSVIRQAREICAVGRKTLKKLDVPLERTPSPLAMWAYETGLIGNMFTGTPKIHGAMMKEVQHELFRRAKQRCGSDALKDKVYHAIGAAVRAYNPASYGNYKRYVRDAVIPQINQWVDNGISKPAKPSLSDRVRNRKS